MLKNIGLVRVLEMTNIWKLVGKKEVKIITNEKGEW